MTFPDASTTGVPPGTSLTTVDGNFTSSYAGQIINALKSTTRSSSTILA